MPAVRGSFDVVIRNGRIVDGTGSPWFLGDVGIQGDRVAAIDNLARATADRVIDATGKVVCPGFIDVHVHSELGILTGEIWEARITQGVTTDLLAPDGLSYAPLSRRRLEETRKYLAIFYGLPELDWDWSSQAEYNAQFDGKVALNVVPQVAFNAVRTEAIGWENRPASADELERMKQLTRETMEAGATGIQTGLEYFPSAHSSTEELIELCKVVSEHGGVYSSHIRGYGATLQASLDEVFRIAEEADIPVHFSHFSGSEGFYDPLEEARARGIDVTFEAYPYMAGCTHMIYCFPSWAQAGGPDAILGRLADPRERDRIRPEINHFFTDRDFPLEKITFVNAGEGANAHLAGKTLARGLEESGKDLTDFMADLLVEEQLQVLLVFHWHDEDRLRRAFQHPLGMVGSDGVFSKGKPHPRGTGCFPRVLGELVRNRKWLTLEEAVRRMAGAPAQRYRLFDRGLLRPGMAADVVVFDPETITDRSTYEEGHLLSEGVEYVLVNGEFVLDRGQMTSATPGRVIGRNG